VGLSSGNENTPSNASVAGFAEVHACGFLSERQESDLTFPLSFKAAFSEEQYIFDSLGDRDSLTDLKDSGHRQAGGDTRINISPHRRHVMREQNAVLSRSPFKYFRVTSTDQSRILDTQDIQFKLAAQQPAQDTIVEIFVNR
jgi:hypothetical protein